MVFLIEPKIIIIQCEIHQFFDERAILPDKGKSDLSTSKF